MFHFSAIIRSSSLNVFSNANIRTFLYLLSFKTMMGSPMNFVLGGEVDLFPPNQSSSSRDLLFLEILIFASFFLQRFLFSAFTFVLHMTLLPRR